MAAWRRFARAGFVDDRAARAVGRGVRRAAQHPDHRPRPGGQEPVRRQSAEGRRRQEPVGRAVRAAPRRPDGRRRRRLQARDPHAGPRAGRQRQRRSCSSRRSSRSSAGWPTGCSSSGTARSCASSTARRATTSRRRRCPGPSRSGRAVGARSLEQGASVRPGGQEANRWQIELMDRGETQGRPVTVVPHPVPARRGSDLGGRHLGQRPHGRHRLGRRRRRERGRPRREGPHGRRRAPCRAGRRRGRPRSGTTTIRPPCSAARGAGTSTPGAWSSAGTRRSSTTRRSSSACGPRSRRTAAPGTRCSGGA